MITKTVKVTDKGQISIPVDIRESIGINKGDELILIQDNNKILIKKVSRVAYSIKDDFSDMLKLAEESLNDVWNNKEDDIWEEYMKDESNER